MRLSEFIRELQEVQAAEGTFDPEMVVISSEDHRAAAITSVGTLGSATVLIIGKLQEICGDEG